MHREVCPSLGGDMADPSHPIWPAPSYSCTIPGPLGSPRPNSSQDGGSLCTSVAASPAGLHCLDGTHKVLGRADTKDLEEGDAPRDPNHNNGGVLQPLLKLAHAVFSVDGAPLLQRQWELPTVATLGAEEIFCWVPDAAGEGDPTALLAQVQVSAAEIQIEVSTIRPSGSTAKLIFLSKEILKVNVVLTGPDIVTDRRN